MTDYQGRLKVTLQGLDLLKQLDDRLASIESRADNVREAIAGIGNEISTNLGRKNRALRDLADTREERLSSQGSVRSTAQRRNAQRGTFLQGPNVNARRLARARLDAAEAETKNAQLELGQALQERRDIVRRGRRLEQRTLPSLELGKVRVKNKRENILGGVTESASSTNQQLRLGGFEAQYERRLQAFRRGGGGTNAKELIGKVFEITQAYNVLKRVISATGDTSAKVTRRQAAELSALSSTLSKYNEAQLEANRLARSRVERLSAARKLGDRLRPMEAASGTARDPKTGELLYPNVTRPAFPRREVGKARLLVNRAASAAESGDQELFRLASFQAKKIIDRMEAGAKAGLKNAPSSPIGGTRAMVDSPAYNKEQQRQQRAQQRQQRQQGQQKGFFQGDLRKALGEGLIGGGFPLLFGQGLGASVGGAAGGLAGGAIGGSFGFGLAIAGTAVGQVVDTTVKNLTELADAIRSPSKALDALEKSGLASSRSLEGTRLYVDQLTSVGRAYDAQTLVLQEVQKRLGPGSLTELNKLDTAQQKLQEQWGVIASEIQFRLLPVLQGFVEFLGFAAGAIKDSSGSSRLERVDPAKFRELQQQAKKENYNFMGVGGIGFYTGNVNSRKRYDTRLNELSKQELAKRFANERASVSQTPEEKFTAETARIQESRKLADQVQSAYREAFSLQRQAYDLQRDGAMLNRDIADYSYKKEREIFDLRQQAAEKRIDNSRASAQNRIEGSDLNARQTFSAAVGFEQQLLTNVRESVRARKEGEADIEQSRKKLELAMAKLNRDVEDYKRTNAREIEDIEQRKQSYARSVEDYKMKVADYVLQRSREAADLMRQAMMLPTVATPAAGAGGGGAIGGSKLSQLIGGAESYGGNYGAFNRGGSNNGHTAHGSGIDPSLANMTIAEIQRRQLAPGVPAGQQLHAVGKYQIIGSTMRSLMQGNYGPTGVSASDRFTPDVQEKLGSALARNRVQGRSVEQGMQGLRQEWIGLQNVSDAKLREAVIELQRTGNLQGQTATQVSSIPQPKFNPVAIGATPSAAPLNAANMAARLELVGGEKEAQRLLEEQNKLKLKGIELGQIEQILQANQLPQLKQQGDTLKRQIEARQKILDLTDNAASVADIEAESKTRLLQIEKDRVSALAKAQKQYGNDPAIAKQINTLAGKAAEIAKGEEKQRRVNLEDNNKLQNQERSRSAILQLQEGLAIGKAQAAALERGALEATNVELLKASDLYRFASDAEKARLADLTAQTEELSKQNDFRKQINEIRQDTRFTGAGLRAGLIGPEARAYEQGLKTFNGDTAMAMGVASETKRLENERLVWANLEKDIISVSDAISGGLTNGLVDIVSGARTIQDVGRDMLDTVARSFADTAQQQLGTLMQRQLGGLLGGAQGPLVKALGAGAEAAGPQALGSASMLASGQVAAFGLALQTVTAQMAFSGALGGGSGLGGLLGSALGGGAGNLFSKPLSGAIPGIAFGGFLAEGGTAQAGKGYVVGENEPEFFFPGVTGRVVPKSDIEKANALRQADTQSDPLELGYTVKEVQGERMVSEAQMLKNNERLLKMAEAKTLAKLRNNSEARSFVGI